VIVSGVAATEAINSGVIAPGAINSEVVAPEATVSVGEAHGVISQEAGAEAATEAAVVKP
jgi:hypothetical protein